MTTSAAQVAMEPWEHLSPSRQPGPTTPSTIADLKLQTAERLAAHRALRRQPAHYSATQDLFEPQVEAQERPETRAMRIAAAVAERYAQSQSYRAFLAAEAEHALERARTAAEAARDAKAEAMAQQQLLSDLENWIPEDAYQPAPQFEEQPRVAAARIPSTALSVRLYEESTGVARPHVRGTANAVPYETLQEEDRQALDEEIEFRQAPVFEELLEAATPIAANLIEFPRQLVAVRKARPRLAEGPLRAEFDPTDSNTQLRIFEVEADQISMAVETEPHLPEWSSIRLGACAVPDREVAPEYPVRQAPPILAAPFGLRVMAAAVDGSILAAAFLAFATVDAFTAKQVPAGPAAVIGSAVVLAVLFLLYQILFFTLGEATPGMRYARIGLCTLGDENPSRTAMRRRILALILAACPLGLGILWAWLDHDGLGWHDRMSRMYQRSY